MSRMAKKRNPTRLKKKEVLAFYDELDDRGRRHRRNGLSHYYALRPEDVWALMKQQGGCCPICLGWLTLEAGSGVGITIDHEGEKRRGRVRGVLHSKCNLLLGLLEELHGDPDSDPTIDLPREYLDNPPAKNIEVADSNLYDDKIEDRKERSLQGRICQREGCGKKISATTNARTKYCSPQCKSAVHNAKAHKKVSERRRKARQGLKCLFCKKRFDGSRLGQKFCSPECRAKFWRESRRGNLPDRECLKCGDPIDPDVNLQQKYCSPKCKQDARNARRRKNN